MTSFVSTNPVPMDFTILSSKSADSSNQSSPDSKWTCLYTHTHNYCFSTLILHDCCSLCTISIDQQRPWSTHTILVPSAAVDHATTETGNGSTTPSEAAGSPRASRLDDVDKLAAMFSSLSIQDDSSVPTKTTSTTLSSPKQSAALSFFKEPVSKSYVDSPKKPEKETPKTGNGSKLASPSHLTSLEVAFRKERVNKANDKAMVEAALAHLLSPEDFQYNQDIQTWKKFNPAKDQETMKNDGDEDCEAEPMDVDPVDPMDVDSIDPMGVDPVDAMDVDPILNQPRISSRDQVRSQTSIGVATTPPMFPTSPLSNSSTFLGAHFAVRVC